MVDVLIRGLSAEDVARIDLRAQRLGMSRAEYLRRAVEQEARRGIGSLAASDFEKLAGLGNEELMRDAWS